MHAEGFPTKLDMVLKACSISRARLAADMGVDKSVVSRWLSGVNVPTDHNLATLTKIVGTRIPGFSMHEWDVDVASLAARVGSGGRPAPTPTAGGSTRSSLEDWLPEPIVAEALTTTASRGSAYEGFWRSTRVANEFPGRFMHDSIMIRREANGLLRFHLGVVEMRFVGWALPIQTQLFCWGVDAPTGVFIFAILNGVLRLRAEVMDGLTLTLTRESGGAPVAAAALMERTGVLSGDREADDATFEAASGGNPLAPEGSIPKNIRDHLFRDTGPTAFARGGEALLRMAFATSLSRGAETGMPPQTNVVAMRKT